MAITVTRKLNIWIICGWCF